MLYNGTRLASETQNGDSSCKGKRVIWLRIDEYISQFPEDVQQILVKIRESIRESAPQALEKISYQIPCFYQNGNLVWFAAYKHHIGKGFGDKVG
jgi:hypothetical protein